MTGFAQLVLLNEDCVGEIRADMEKLFSELDRVVEALDDLRSYAASLLERDPAASRGT